LLNEQADGKPDRAAGGTIRIGQPRLGGQLATRGQDAGGDLVTQIVGDLFVLGAGHVILLVEVTEV